MITFTDSRILVLSMYSLVPLVDIAIGYDRRLGRDVANIVPTTGELYLTMASDALIPKASSMLAHMKISRPGPGL